MINCWSLSPNCAQVAALTTVARNKNKQHSLNKKVKFSPVVPYVWCALPSLTKLTHSLGIQIVLYFPFLLPTSPYLLLLLLHTFNHLTINPRSAPNLLLTSTCDLNKLPTCSQTSPKMLCTCLIVPNVLPICMVPIGPNEPQHIWNTLWTSKNSFLISTCLIYQNVLLPW